MSDDDIIKIEGPVSKRLIEIISELEAREEEALREIKKLPNLDNLKGGNIEYKFEPGSAAWYIAYGT